MASTEPIALEPALAGQQTLPPIPLRTLVTLINYQCSVNSERYSARSLYDREAFRRASLRRNTFHYDSSLQQSPYLPATCSVHPNRKAGADDLSSAQLERIFYQSRWQNRNIIFAQVFRQFFLRCAENQELIVQIRNEQPKLVKSRDVILSHVHGMEKNPQRLFCYFLHDIRVLVLLVHHAMTIYLWLDVAYRVW